MTAGRSFADHTIVVRMLHSSVHTLAHLKQQNVVKWKLTLLVYFFLLILRDCLSDVRKGELAFTQKSNHFLFLALTPVVVFLFKAITNSRDFHNEHFLCASFFFFYFAPTNRQGCFLFGHHPPTPLFQFVRAANVVIVHVQLHRNIILDLVVSHRSDRRCGLHSGGGSYNRLRMLFL